MHPLSRSHLRSGLLALGLLAALGSSAAPAIADASSTTVDPESQLEKSRSRRAELAVQIDLLKADDLQLQAEAQRLSRLVDENEKHASDAKAELEGLNEQLVQLEGAVAEAQAAADQQQKRAAERAIEAYMHPGEEGIDAVLGAKDYDEAHKRRALLGEVAHYDQEVLKSRRKAQDALAAKQQELAETRLKVEQVQAAASADLAAAAASRDAKAEVQDALEHRISEFKGEADQLAASEGNLLALINARTSRSGDTPEDDPADPGDATTTTTEPPSTTTTTAAPSTTTTKLPGSTIPGQPTTTTTTRAPTTTTTKAPTPSTTTTTVKPKPGLHLSWPLSGTLTSGFGMRWGRMHKGIDIAVPTGTPVRAAAAGTAYVGEDPGGYGHFLIIDHGNGVVTVYGHLNSVGVADASRVGSGAVVAYSGNTGHSTGPHLHFEVRIDGVAVDPMGYLG